MTILDVAEVQDCITKLEVTARDANGKYMHRWIIGENADKQPPAVWWDIGRGIVTVFPVKINAHNDPVRNGLPEMGWGLKKEPIPQEILNAEITHLSMRCTDGVAFTVTVDVEMTAMACEMAKVAIDQEQKILNDAEEAKK